MIRFLSKRMQSLLIMSTKNTKGKKIQIEVSNEIMGLIERYQNGMRELIGPPQINRPEIVATFLEEFKKDIEDIIIALEERAQNLK